MNTKDWEKIKQITLVGLEHLPLSSSALSQLEQLGVDIEEQSEVQTLLEAIAYLSQLEQARLPMDSADFDLPTSSFSTETAWLHPLSVQHLAVLFNYHQDAFPEFSLLAQSQQRYLPPEYIPIIMPHLKGQPFFWQHVVPLLEEQSMWLIRQHPNWIARLKKPLRPSSPSIKPIAALQKLKTFQDSLYEGRNFMDQAEWQQLKKGAYQVEINQFRTFQNDWQMDRIQHSMWRGNVLQLNRILKFRLSMRGSFEI
ncbi:MAG: hypothetical protein AAGI23_10360 [Bacteroidota bacterium]